MKTANVLVKPCFEVCSYNNIKFSLLNKLLLDVAPLYPNFDSWINFTFRRNLSSGERHILIAHNGVQVIGTALLKKTHQESKICTFYIAPQYRGRNVGHELMDLALSTLDCHNTFITVSEERNEELLPLLSAKGFSISQSIAGFYRKESTEYFYKL